MLEIDKGKLRLHPLLLTAFFLSLLTQAPAILAQDLKKVTDLKGAWAFSIGDDMKWADLHFDDSEWDKLYVPKEWEEQGYRHYNGYAWYRKHFTLSKVGKNVQMQLIIGGIDDVDEVFINGKKVGGMGNADPAMFKSAYNTKRKYNIAPDLLNFDGNNLIAVRVFDAHMGGGIDKAPVGLYYDMDIALLSINLSGKWKFKLGDDSLWKMESLDASKWDDIQVPSKWERQGYDDYDGCAWYRKSFRLPKRLMLENLYLVLGKIDDVDQVYLNGQKVGSVFQIKKQTEMWRHYKDHEVFRAYPLPKEILKPGLENHIAIRVIDTGGDGGIYQGPIGITTEDNYEIIESRYYSSSGKSILEYFLQEIFE